MSAPSSQRIVCLSNPYDENYAKARIEAIEPCLSSSKRRDLFRCLEQATGREVVVLSFPPKASRRRTPRWLHPVETRFSTHRQLVSANWDLPKLRVPLGWFFYALHTVRHTRSGDLIVIDNYELIWVLAACLSRLFRRVSFVLDYEDGKHLTDRSWSRIFSSLAERVGRNLVSVALLAHPDLGRRLPARVPTVLVPGFVVPPSPLARKQRSDVRFLYSGSLGHVRGVDLLVNALKYLPETGWRLDITGTGELNEAVETAVAQPRYRGKVTFHGTLPADSFNNLLAACDVGLNCQRVSDPISGVTFPSKVFTYLSAGLLVLSSRASRVDDICGAACYYYDEETPEALAAAMIRFIEGRLNGDREAAGRRVAATYSIEGTASRLKELLKAARLI